MSLMPTQFQRGVKSASIYAEDAIKRYDVLGVPVGETTLKNAIATVSSWIETKSSPRLVTFTNVHMLTEAHADKAFLQILQEMDLNCPDGMPLVWLGKLEGRPVGRVCGPEFMPAFCGATANLGYRHFFYGGGAGVAEKVVEQLTSDSPSIQIAGWHTPPFRKLEPKEDDLIVQKINDSNADIVWVCLGCPKQEKWMAEHRHKLNVRAMCAVGMAFDTIAGTKKRAPRLLRSYGMEWLYRTCTEPRRLAQRYFSSNLMFLWLLAQQTVSGL